MRIKTSSTSWLAFAITAGTIGAWTPEAAADECVPAPSQGMRACDPTTLLICPDGFGNRSVNYFTDGEAYEYLHDLDDLVDGAAGVEYMARIHLGNPVWLALLMFGGASGVEARPNLWAVRVTENAGDPDVTKPAILLAAGVHAQEWIAQETALGMVDRLVKAANGAAPYDDSAEVARVRALLAEREIWFVVISNPVGREVEIEEDGNWGTPVYSEVRKNRQWDPDFVCSAEWAAAEGGGKCWPGIGTETGIPRDNGGGPHKWTSPA